MADQRSSSVCSSSEQASDRSSALTKTQSPVNGGDYEGLQVDTRAKDSTDKHLDPQKGPQLKRDWSDVDDGEAYLNEKQIASVGQIERGGQSPISPGNTLVADPETPYPKTMDSDVAIRSGSPPEPRVWKICGLRRRNFWILFGTILAVIIVVSIIGGVLGGRKKQTETQTPSTMPAGTLPPPVASAPSAPSDVIVDSPLYVLSYDNNGTGSPENRQSFRMYFQSVNGNIKESTSDGLSTWQAANPIFTDAINNTGLAAVIYMNGTQQQGGIFYVGTNGLLQEKRKYNITNSSAIWLPGNLNNKNIPMVGNITVPVDNNNDPKNSWDSYRMAAVYSASFQSGPGVRLYYHAEELNGTSWVQEMIWDQQNDTWSVGAAFYDAWPSSHLAATVDESSKILRLFFSSGNLTLSEYYTNVSSPDSSYHKGLQLPSYLHTNNGDLAALSTPLGTSLFHYSPQLPLGIRELHISGSPLSPNSQESFNLSEPLVSSPNLSSTAGTGLYQPLTASVTMAKGLDTQVYAFWADTITGEAQTGKGGYSQLSEISRNLGNLTWPAGGKGQMSIPLGVNNA